MIPNIMLFKKLEVKIKNIKHKTILTNLHIWKT